MLYYEGWATETRAPQAEPLEHWQETLLKAADLIEKVGWCQTRYVDDDGGICSSEAINRIESEGSRPYRHREMLTKFHLREYLNAPCIEIWNDMPGRTKSQVLTALREAAAKKR